MDEFDCTNVDPAELIDSYPLKRRSFLKGLGGGILILVSLRSAPAALGQARNWQPYTDFNAFLKIGEDGRVTCAVGKIEMGQGIITSLPQMVADELDVPLESVDLVIGDTDICPYDVGTFGSLTTRSVGQRDLRPAAAAGREALLELAAEHLGVPAGRLETHDGIVSVKGERDKSVAYGELTKGREITKHLKAKGTLKAAADLKVMGKPLRRVDSASKVTGEALYAGDVRMDGMLYARIVRPPAHGAKLKSVDTSAAEAMDGVKVVRDGDLVAVLHERPDMAARALQAVKAEFDVPEPKVDDKSIFEHLVKVAGDGKRVAGGGKIADGEAAAETVIEETYLDGYVAHATIETHTALAQVEGDRATVWASTQTPYPLRREAAGTLEVPEENVRVRTPFLGGGFGGKTSNGQAAEAVRLAKLAGKPVQVAWTRQEEFFFDAYRPAAVVKIKSGLTAEGRLAFWDYGVYFAGSRGAGQFYQVPHHVTYSYESAKEGSSAHPFATGPWRAPAANTNTFARESHIDTLAAAAGVDPVEFRLQHLDNSRLVNALEAARDKFGWTPAAGPSGRGYGMACGTDTDTWVAVMVEVEVDERTGHVQVKRAVVGQDMGLVVNPQGATIQAEGCVTMGLGYALSEDIRFEGGKILETNFDTYELPRFSAVPATIDTMLVPNDEHPPAGGGEPAIICMGGAVANAIFDATGARVLQMPMTPQRVREAIANRKAAPNA